MIKRPTVWETLADLWLGAASFFWEKGAIQLVLLAFAIAAFTIRFTLVKQIAGVVLVLLASYFLFVSVAVVALCLFEEEDENMYRP